MFAYCGNNPVDRADPEGKIWRFFLFIGACILGCTGCSSCGEVPDGVREDIAQAPDLNIYTPNMDNTTYNCYGNAIGKQINTNPTGWHPGATAEEVFGFVQNDLGGTQNCIRVDGIDSPIPQGWYLVALMCNDEDYHFIRQDASGMWINKSGKEIDLGYCFVSETYVAAGNWYVQGLKPSGLPYSNTSFEYTDAPIYFLVRKGWDKCDE